MKRLLNTKNTLKCCCVIIWTLVVTFTVLLINNLYLTNQAPVDEKPMMIETIDEEENMIPSKIASDILTMSISFCKNEYAEDIGKAVYKASKKHNIPVYVIYAIITTESGLRRTENINKHNINSVNPNAKSSANCIGLMQISEYALADYNRIHNTEYSINDLYNVDINIEVGTWYYVEVGTWYFNQFKNVATWLDMYIMYNVGYGRYNKVNHYWFYGSDGCWYNGYRNSFFFRNGMYPPTDNNHGLYGENKLETYRPKERFEKCLELCYQYFHN